MANRLAVLAVTYIFANTVYATGRYHGIYQRFPTGDTFINLAHTEGGPELPERKWIAECFYGEALTGLSDGSSDFENVDILWCQGKFPVNSDAVILTDNDALERQISSNTIL